MNPFPYNNYLVLLHSDRLREFPRSAARTEVEERLMSTKFILQSVKALFERTKTHVNKKNERNRSQQQQL